MTLVVYFKVIEDILTNYFSSHSYLKLFPVLKIENKLLIYCSPEKNIYSESFFCFFREMKKVCLFTSKKCSFANVQKMQYPHFSERCIAPILGVQNLQHFTPTKSILSEKGVRVKMRMEGGRRTRLYLCPNNLQI